MSATSPKTREQFKHAATVCGQEGPGWLFGGIRRGHARNIDAPEGEYESAEARRDEPGREGALQHVDQIKLGNGDCNPRLLGVFVIFFVAEERL
jgi:hypothetical protein